MSHPKFYTLVEIATGKVREAGYEDFGLREGLDTAIYEVVEHDALPEGLIVEPTVPHAVAVAAARAGLLQQYKAAPLELRTIFSALVTEINGLLDLEDFELAALKASYADTSVIADPELRQQANALKAAFVAGLSQLAAL